MINPVPPMTVRETMVRAIKENPIEIDVSDIFSFNTYFSWGQKGVGFGQCNLSVKNDETGTTITGDSELMSAEWIRQALHALVDSVMDKVPFDSRDIDVRVDLPKEEIDRREAFNRLLNGA